MAGYGVSQYSSVWWHTVREDLYKWTKYWYLSQKKRQKKRIRQKKRSKYWYLSHCIIILSAFHRAILQECGFNNGIWGENCRYLMPMQWTRVFPFLLSLALLKNQRTGHLFDTNFIRNGLQSDRSVDVFWFSNFLDEKNEKWRKRKIHAPTDQSFYKASVDRNLGTPVFQH